MEGVKEEVNRVLPSALLYCFGEYVSGSPSYPPLAISGLFQFIIYVQDRIMSEA